MTTVQEQYDRLPPHSIDAEQCLIGCIILEPRTIAEVGGMVAAGDFYHLDHKTIWAVLSAMIHDGKPVDAVTLRDELKSRNVLEDVGGAQYIATILYQVPSALHVKQYAAIVKDKSMLRQLIEASNDAISGAYAPRVAGTAHDLVAHTVTRIGQIMASANSTKISQLDVVADSVFDSLSKPDGSQLEPTGFADLDSQIGGVQAGEMIIVAARPSMGKSTLARGIAWRRAKRGFPTGIISLEESKEKIARNIFAAESSVENQRIRRRQLTKDDWQRLSDSMVCFCEKPLYIADRAFKLNAIKAVAAEMVARYRVKLVVVDYLQRVQTEGRDRFSKVTEASLGICEMLKELNIAGIVLSQLNRAVETREEKRPGMADLRESGQIEQDADGIIFIHREDYYHTHDEGYEPSKEVELILAKMRDGVRGDTVRLVSSLNFQRFDDVIPSTM